jgi:hypothetical protein
MEQDRWYPAWDSEGALPALIGTLRKYVKRLSPAGEIIAAVVERRRKDGGGLTEIWLAPESLLPLFKLAMPRPGDTIALELNAHKEWGSAHTNYSLSVERESDRRYYEVTDGEARWVKSLTRSELADAESDAVTDISEIL